MRCLNKVTLIGNVVKKPELKRLDGDGSVCTFHIITDREWTTNDGKKRQDSMRHICTAWNKLAEICSNLLERGTTVYVDGMLTSVKVPSQAKPDQQIEEIRVSINEMIILNQPRFNNNNGHTNSNSKDK